MQPAFDLGQGADLRHILETLSPFLGEVSKRPRLTPMAQLVRSLIGSREKDGNSWHAFDRLRMQFPDWTALAAAEPAEIGATLAGINFAPGKAQDIVIALSEIGRTEPGLDLDFLRGLPVDQAHAWLTRLHGVGPKIAAAVLNFSTLEMPAFVVDTHVKRVLIRFGFVRQKATFEQAFAAVTAVTPGWSATELEDLHIEMKRLGQTLCTHGSARCGPCPLAARCARVAER